MNASPFSDAKEGSLTPEGVRDDSKLDPSKPKSKTNPKGAGLKEPALRLNLMQTGSPERRPPPY
jgi:hypothetical protein